MDIIKGARASSMIGTLEEAANQARRKKVDGWIQALKAAEASAVTRKSPLRLYQANYRIEDEVSATKGSSEQRREALRKLFRSLAPKERHPSTSTWLFQLHIEKATDLANLFAPPLDTAKDFLAVAELTPNRTTVGNARLKP